MILPTKHLTQDRALLTVGADILRWLKRPSTVSYLWDNYKRDANNAATYDWFVLALDLLFTLNAIELSAGLLRRTE